MKKYIFLLVSFFALNSYAQIITNETQSEPKKEKKEKKERVKKEREKLGMELFFGASPAYTFRTLQEGKGVFGKPLGERVNEKANWTFSYHAGARTALTKNLKLEFGAGYYTNKENYDYEATDTVFRYANTYRHISIPIRLAYTYGDQISFYGGIGFIPKAFLSMKREETTLDINKKEVSESWRVRDGYNMVLIDAVATIGTQLKLSENYGIYAMVEGRRQLINNYSKQGAYIRKSFALGFHFGIEIYL